MRTPKKVLDKARADGMEEECLWAGFDLACLPCSEIMRAAFDSFYGHLRFGPQIASAIYFDLQLEDMGVYDD